MSLVPKPSLLLGWVKNTTMKGGEETSKHGGQSGEEGHARRGQIVAGSIAKGLESGLPRKQSVYLEHG